MYWYPASFELDYPSIAVDFESRDEAIRQSAAVHYLADDDVWLVGGAGHHCNDNQSPGLETWTIDDNTGAITYGRLP